METVVKRAQQEAKREYVPGLTLTAWERIAYIKGATFAATVTAEQVEAAEAAIIEMLHDADEDGEGLDDLDLAQRAVAVTLNALGLRAGGEQA